MPSAIKNINKRRLNMSVKKVGTIIKEERTKAGLTQEQLAKKVAGLSAADISKAERGEKTLTQEQLKAVAKALGITQKTLLDASKGASSDTDSGGSVKLSAAEKKLITLYRKADADTKKAAVQLLEKGAEETGNILTSLLGGFGGGSASSGTCSSGTGNSGAGSLIGSLLGGSGSNAGATLLGALLGGGSNNSNNGTGGNNGGSNSGTDLLGSLIGGVLGGKRDMPDDEKKQ